MAADHRAEVVRVDPDLEPLTAAGVDQTDTNIVRIVDDAFDKVFKRRSQHDYSPLVSEASSAVASTSSVLADSSALAADFFDFGAALAASSET